MSAADTLFCFTSNRIDSHFCPNCHAPMLVRSTSARRNLRARAFECFNCATVVVKADDRSKPHLNSRSRNIRSSGSVA
jgi:hypothetical protein